MNLLEKLTEVIRQVPAQLIMKFDKTCWAAQFPFRVKIFFSEANKELGEKICRELALEPGKFIGFWPNNDVRVQLLESVKGCYCFVIGSYHDNANIRHMELKAIIRTCKESGAEKVIAVIPFLGYTKQEKKKEGREGILAKMICQEICSAGADHIVVIDLHADAIEGFFNGVPVDHLHALKIIIEELRKDKSINFRQFTGVSPDVGGVARVRKFINVLGSWLAIIFKYRPTPESADMSVFMGELKDICCILDDLIQAATTFVESVIKLIEKGARKIFGCIIHGDWCGDAIKNMRLLMLSGAVDRFYITDTTPLPAELRELPNIYVISVAPLLAEAIRRIFLGESLSSLYELDEEKKEKKPPEVPVEIRLQEAIEKHRGVKINLKEILEEGH